MQVGITTSPCYAGWDNHFSLKESQSATRNQIHIDSETSDWSKFNVEKSFKNICGAEHARLLRTCPLTCYAPNPAFANCYGTVIAILRMQNARNGLYSPTNSQSERSESVRKRYAYQHWFGKRDAYQHWFGKRDGCHMMLALEKPNEKQHLGCCE